MKDAKGHGSDPRGGGKMPIEGHDYHTKTDAQLHYIAKDAAEAAKAMQGHSPGAEGKYLDQVNNASTVLGYRARGGAQVVHAIAAQHGIPTGHLGVYNPTSVNNAIASSNRAGRRIGGKEAAAIHSLLKGRH